jgi:hypothetical protein
VTPLGWEHISLMGDYIWADDAAPVDGSLLWAKQSLLAA